MEELRNKPVSYTHLIHKPNVFGERGDLLGGYYFAVLTSGVVKFDAMRDYL